MQQKEIVECNKLIAEFMGVTVRKDGRLALKEGELLTGQCIVAAKYHYSWDWLMDVVDKIWTLGPWDFEISYGYCGIEGDHNQQPRIKESADTTIEAVWQAVVQFINWHNANHPK